MGCNITCVIEVRCEGKWAYHSALKLQRNYSLFAMLADVCNTADNLGRPSASAEDDRINPIHPRRGLPTDVSSAICDETRNNGYCHSWATLRELIDYGWGQTFCQRGWVSADEYLRFKQFGKPDGWSLAVGGGATEHVSNEAMDQRIKAGTAAHCRTMVAWWSTYGDAAGHFFDVAMAHLRTLGAPEDVRIVFWFDG